MTLMTSYFPYIINSCTAGPFNL